MLPFVPGPSPPRNASQALPTSDAAHFGSIISHAKKDAPPHNNAMSARKAVAFRLRLAHGSPTPPNARKQTGVRAGQAKEWPRRRGRRAPVSSSGGRSACRGQKKKGGLASPARAEAETWRRGPADTPPERGYTTEGARRRH
jgi:hypothetical protein